MKQILIVGVLLFSQATFFKQEPVPSGADLDWVEQNLREATNLTLPLESSKGPFYVVYRSSRDSFMATGESYFAIDFGERPPTSVQDAQASLVTMTGGSLRNQLIAQRVADRDAALGTLLLRISVRRTTHTAASCRPLKNRLDEFSQLVLPLVPKPNKYIALHATSHEVMISVPGQRLNASFSDVENPLARWAIATLDTLNACALPPR